MTSAAVRARSGTHFGFCLRPAALVALGLSGAAAVLVTAAWAEDGLQLTFDAGLRLDYQSNPDLTPVKGKSSTTGGLDLSFGVISETAVSSLTLTGSAGLFTADGAAGNLASGLTDPELDLAYTRNAANSAVSLDGSLQQSDVASGGDIENFMTGHGQRRVTSLSAALDLGTSRLLGFGLTAGASAISYHDNPDPGLIDSHTERLGTTLRADLSPVLHANFGLQASRFAQEGAADRETQSYSTELTLDRPTGPLALLLTLDDTPDGQRSRLGFEQTLALATGGTLTYGMGVTRGVTDKTFPDGEISYAQDLPLGSINLDVSRAVQAGAETDAETVQSRASLGYSHTVTPRANLALALNWAEQRSTATDLATANTNLSATWTQTITEDWVLDLGVTHLIRDQDAVGHGQSDQIFLSLRRVFGGRS